MGKIEELLVNKGLYDSVEISVDDIEEIERLFLCSLWYQSCI